MPDGMTFKENLDNEKSKWNNMNWKQRISYFRTYYLLPIVIITVITCVIVYLILNAFVFKKEIAISGMVINFDLDDVALNDFETSYLKFIGANPSKQCVNFRSQFVSKEDYNSLMVIQTNVGASTVDFMIVDEKAYDLLNEQSIYKNLEDVLDAATFEKVKDRVVETVDIDTQIVYPGAINISDTQYARKYLPGQDSYLVFIVGGNHIDDSKQILEYFLSY